MPLPEGYLPREGDILLIPVRVYGEHTRDDEKLYVTVVGAEHNRVFVPRENVHSFVSRQWESGDRCRMIRNPIATGAVIAASGEKVWVCLDAGDDLLVQSQNLEEIPVDPIDEDFTEKPSHSSPASVPLGGAHLPEPFCDPPPRLRPSDDDIEF